jgi:hypothetical protein
MLTEQQKEIIAKFLPIYKKYLESAEYQQDKEAHQLRQKLYSEVLSSQKIDQMTELEFGQVISSLWAAQMYGKKSILVDNLLRDNDLPKLKFTLKNLLWGDDTIVRRFNKFRKETKGIGTAMISELLAFIHPQSYGVWTDKTRKGLTILGFAKEYPFIKKPQLKGDEYDKFNQLVLQIRDELVAQGIKIIDLLDVNLFIYEVWKNGALVPPITPGETPKIPTPTTISDFDHDEVVEKLVAMGAWLGFDVEKEKLISQGARVDVIWQARIANLGVVTYVFEVQRRGSIDSLILNLQKALNNPSVQRLVVVALDSDLKRIRNEVDALPEGFRKAMSYMEVSEALRASELLSEFSEIINELNLVQSEFGGLVK